jgi:putative SOS response-associated peptidase YedK
MCGGVIFPYKKEYKALLDTVYSPEEVAQFEATGEVRSLYWQGPDPVLPVLVEAEGTGSDTEAGDPELKLMRWGNRDKNKPLPQTGWARLESIEEGKWGYLKPKPAIIPVSHGVEKGKWFEINNGIAGLVVEKAGEERIYMLTEAADDDFLSHTHHNRMPVLLNQSDIPWLSGDPAGTTSTMQSSFSVSED